MQRSDWSLAADDGMAAVLGAARPKMQTVSKGRATMQALALSACMASLFWLAVAATLIS